MKKMAFTVVLASGAVLIGLAGNSTLGMVGNVIWLTVPVVLIAGIALAVGKTRRRAVLIASGSGFLAIVAPAVVVAVAKDMGSKPNCDGFCMTRAQASVFIVFLAIFWGFALAAVSALAVAVFYRPRPGHT